MLRTYVRTRKIIEIDQSAHILLTIDRAGNDRTHVKEWGKRTRWQRPGNQTGVLTVRRWNTLVFSDVLEPEIGLYNRIWCNRMMTSSLHFLRIVYSVKHHWLLSGSWVNVSHPCCSQPQIRYRVECTVSTETDSCPRQSVVFYLWVHYKQLPIRNFYCVRTLQHLYSFCSLRSVCCTCHKSACFGMRLRLRVITARARLCLWLWYPHCWSILATPIGHVSATQHNFSTMLCVI